MGRLQKCGRHPQRYGLWVFAQGWIANGAGDFSDLGWGMAKGRKARTEPRPLRSASDQATSGKAMVEQSMAQFKVQHVGKCQDQMLGVLRGEGYGLGWIRYGQGADALWQGCREAVGGDVDPGD
jgi:hypothetical protein